MKKARTDGMIFFPGAVLLFIGTLYLIVNSSDVFVFGAALSDTSETKEPADWKEMAEYIQTTLFVVFGILGGIGLLAGKKWGWLLGAPSLGIYLVVAIRGLYLSIVANMFNEGGMLFIIVCGILCICLTLLLLPSSLKKLRIKSSLSIPAAFIFLLLLLLFAYTQIN
jgi:hypothetical protein